MWGVVFTACVVFFSAHKVIASILKYSVLWIPTDYMLPCQTLRMQRFYVLGGRNIALGVSIAANPMQRIHWIATLLPFQFLPLIPSFSNATILIYTSTLLPFQLLPLIPSFCNATILIYTSTLLPFQLLPLTPSFSNATIPIYTSTLLPFQFLPLIPSFSNATILIYLSFPSLQVKDFLTKPYVPITGPSNQPRPPQNENANGTSTTGALPCFLWPLVLCQKLQRRSFLCAKVFKAICRRFCIAYV